MWEPEQDKSRNYPVTFLQIGTHFTRDCVDGRIKIKASGPLWLHCLQQTHQQSQQEQQRVPLGRCDLPPLARFSPMLIYNNLQHRPLSERPRN